MCDVRAAPVTVVTRTAAEGLPPGLALWAIPMWRLSGRRRVRGVGSVDRMRDPGAGEPNADLPNSRFRTAKEHES
jgi:hypothetical protein